MLHVAVLFCIVRTAAAGKAIDTLCWCIQPNEDWPLGHLHPEQRSVHTAVLVKREYRYISYTCIQYVPGMYLVYNMYFEACMIPGTRIIFAYRFDGTHTYYCCVRTLVLRLYLVSTRYQTSERVVR